MRGFQFQYVHLTVVMPGLDPGIHVLLTNIETEKGVDGRVKPGHDEGGTYISAFTATASPLLPRSRGAARHDPHPDRGRDAR